MGPPRHFRLPFLILAVVLPLMLEHNYLLAWGSILLIWSIAMVGFRAVIGWLRLWIPLGIVYVIILFLMITNPITWQSILLIMARTWIALLGLQIVQWSVPPSDVVRSFEWLLPRLGVSLAIALRLVPRLERSARWRLETLEERGFVDEESKFQRLRTRASIWPGWLADSLDHAHDLGDAVQSRGILTPRRWRHSAPRRALQSLLGEEIREDTIAPHRFSDSVQIGLDLELRLPDGRSIGRHKELLRGGNVILLRGASGCGKSSLLRLLAGVSPWQHPITVFGRAHLSGHPTFGEVNLSEGPFNEAVACWIPQDPDRHGLAESVHREFTIARRLTGPWGQQEMLETLRNWELLDKLDVQSEELSAGEQQRLLLAAHLDPAQPVWLLDEADVHLDESGFVQLGKAVIKHRARGGLIVVVAHRHARWQRIADIEIQMDQNKPPLDYPSVWVESGDVLCGPPIVSLFEHDIPPVCRGELILIIGNNGSGKTTLLREWAQADGLPWLPTSPDRRLLGMTIFDELALQHPVLHAQYLAGNNVTIEGAEPVAVRQSALRLSLGLSHLSEVTPVHDLSTGERRRLSLIPLMMREPPLMLLDEIDHGLDDTTLADLLELLNQQRRQGTSIVLTTHSPDLMTWAKVSGGRLWKIENGTMQEVTE
ncbi:MAG: ATP-binding cassette domain-containing protein [Candidatus Thalassarchaeaceae archaeon]|jgi:ABC-type multidrug transport system ATPase subunit/energy-coupling factor transporter transmembrane protein EcfT|nr:ATP-binding cassette domain-containing protein [Candidatus Thalassarchaeaceae archaeon]